MEERESATHPRELLDSFNRLKTDQNFCDFILQIGDEEIPVHRMVLIASSKYFEALFSHENRETKSGRIEILGIEPSAGKQCIEYVYTGKVEFSSRNPKDLIHAADMLQLHGLLDLYFSFLVEKISVKNCVEYMQIAQMYSRHPFAKVFEKFSIDNFREIVEFDDFVSMNESLLSQCLGSLTHGGEKLEILKWEALITWIYADLDKRENDFPKIFKYVRLEKLSDEFIKKTVFVETLVKDSHPCKDRVLEVLCDRSTESFADTKCDIIVCHGESRMLHRLKIETAEWSRVARIPADIFSKVIDIACCKGELYAITDHALMKLSKDKWLSVMETKLLLSPGRCVVHGEFIYIAAAGFTFEYNVRAQTWTDLKSAHGLGSGFAIAKSSSHIYAVGGEKSNHKAMEFSFRSKSWEPIASMQLGRIEGAALYFEGKLFTVGGYSGSAWRDGKWVEVRSDQAEFFFAESNIWTFVSSSFKCNRNNFNVFIVGKNAYFVGGDKRHRIHVYDWETFELLKTITAMDIKSTFSCASL